SLTRLTSAFLNDDRAAFAMTVHLVGEYGLSVVSLGVPVILGANGLERIIDLALNPEDHKPLAYSGACL
ncbi:L-lactate dehydrogenase, partial [Lacticaseibacillus rhamnosus]